MGLFSKIRKWFSSIFSKKEKKTLKQTIYPKTTTIQKATSKQTIEEKTTSIHESITTEKAKTTTTYSEAEAEKPPVQLQPPITVTKELEKPEVKSEIEQLKSEYEQLMKEKQQIKNEIEELDRKHAIGELTDMERDKIFREKMVRAAYVAQKIFEIKSKLAALGSPVE